MRKIKFIIPGDINQPTGGYRYDKAILQQWREQGISHELISLVGRFPFPSEDEKAAALHQVEEISKGADIVVIDGLAGGVLPEFVDALSRKMPVVSLLHHPLCLETGLDDALAKTLEKTERKVLKYVSHVITTSRETKRLVHSMFDVPNTDIAAIEPGVVRGPLSMGSGKQKKNLLCIGSLIERKGHVYLIEALSQLKHLDWHLNCYGAEDFDPELVQKIKKLIRENELDDYVTLHGAVSDDCISSTYGDADIFVLPSLYEGYGMVFSEAIVRGIPVIGTNAGAIPDTVPDTCGILVAPKNSGELSSAIEKMLTEPVAFEGFKNGAIAAEPNFPTWEKSAAEFFDLLEKIR